MTTKHYKNQMPESLTLSEILSELDYWRNELGKWWNNHQPNEREIAIAKQTILARPDVIKEIEILNRG